MAKSGWHSQQYLKWNMAIDCVESLPLLGIEVTINGETMLMEGLVDSGSQDCILNTTFAKIFKINLDDLPKWPITGVGGHVNGYKTKAKIRIIETGHEFETPIIFADIPLQAILGQEDFFKRFQVLFEKNLGQFQIKFIPPLDHEKQP